MSERWRASVAVDAPSALGEGPWWDAPRGRLLWVDITRGLINAWDPRGGVVVDVSSLGEPVGFVAGLGAPAGGYLAGTASGLVELDADLRPVGPADPPPDLDGGLRRLNDGACDAAGRVLLGTVDPSGAAPGTLWSRSPDGAFAAVVRGVGMSNGVAFSPDGRRLYYVDSLTHQVDRFAYDPASGEASARERFFAVPPSAGLPDGLAVDATGCVWLAIWGAGAVWRVTPDGRHDGTLEVGAARTTSCAFGGGDRDRLYVTTAHEGASALDAPGRDAAPGALFVADVGACGAPVWDAAPAAASTSPTRHGD